MCPGSSEEEVISGVGSSVSKVRKRCSISWTWSPSDFSMFMVDLGSCCHFNVVNWIAEFLFTPESKAEDEY